MYRYRFVIVIVIHMVICCILMSDCHEDVPIKLLHSNGPPVRDLEAKKGRIEDTDWQLMPKENGGSFDKWSYAQKFVKQPCRLCPNVFYRARFAPYMTTDDELNLNDPFEKKSAGAPEDDSLFGGGFLETAARAWASARHKQWLRAQTHAPPGQLLVRKCCKVKKSKYKHNMHYDDMLHYWGGIPARGKLGISGLEAVTKEDKDRAEKRYDVDFLEEKARTRWVFGTFFKKVIHKVAQKAQKLKRKLKSGDVPCCKLCPMDCPPEWRKKTKRPTKSSDDLFGSFRELRTNSRQAKKKVFDVADDQSVTSFLQVRNDPNSASASSPPRDAVEPPRFVSTAQDDLFGSDGGGGGGGGDDLFGSADKTPKVKGTNVNVATKQLPGQGHVFFQPDQLAKPTNFAHVLLPIPKRREFNDHSYVDRDFDPPGMEINPPDRCEEEMKGCCELCYVSWGDKTGNKAPHQYERMHARWRKQLTEASLKKYGEEGFKRNGRVKMGPGDFGTLTKDVATPQRAKQPYGAKKPLKVTFTNALNSETSPSNPHNHMRDHVTYDDNGRGVNTMYEPNNPVGIDVGLHTVRTGV